MKKIRKALLFGFLLAVLGIGVLLPAGRVEAASLSSAGVPSSATKYEGHYYQAYDLGYSYLEAKAYCEELGGYLVVITSEEENSFVTSLAQADGKNCYWIGIYLNSNGDYVWVNGETSSYEGWSTSPKEPNNYNGNQGYGFMYAQDCDPYYSTGEWDDMTEDCTSWDGGSFYGPDNFGFICEWDTAAVTLSKTSYTYTGKAITPSVKVTCSGETLTEDTDYTVSCSNNKNVGTATVTVAGVGDYSGTASKTFTIKKASQSIQVEETSLSLAVGDTVSIEASAKGTLTYTSSDISIAKVSSKGVVTGKRPGTVKITVKAAATSNYKSASKTISVKVKTKTTDKPAVKRVSYSSLKITWEEFSGASGYYVYRSTKSGSGYTKIATITKGSTVTYTDTDRTTGKTYYYKVKAYKKVDGEKTVIAVSRAGSGKATLAKPTVTLTAGSKKITVKISKKVSGASGYVIYRSTKESSGYKAVKTVKSGAAFTWKNSSLKAKTTYYYKVRAYRTVNGKKVYSSYSTIVSKKTK